MKSPETTAPETTALLEGANLEDTLAAYDAAFPATDQVEAPASDYVDAGDSSTVDQAGQELVLHSLDWELEDPTAHPLADIANVDAKGRVHHAGGQRSLKTDKEGRVIQVEGKRSLLQKVLGRQVAKKPTEETQSTAGRFMTKYELEQIEAHAGQIREGLGKHERLIGLMALDSRGLGHRANGQIMSKADVATLNGEKRRDIRAAEKAMEPAEALAYKLYRDSSGSSLRAWNELADEEKQEFMPPKPTVEQLKDNLKGRWADVTSYGRKLKEKFNTEAKKSGNRLHKRAWLIAGAGVAIASLAIGSAITEQATSEHEPVNTSAGEEAGSYMDRGIFDKDGNVRGLTNPDDRQAGATQEDLMADQSGTGEKEGLPVVDDAVQSGVVEKGGMITGIGELAHGENPWSESYDYLVQVLGIANPTNPQIAAIDNWAMQKAGVDVAAGEDERLPDNWQMPIPTIEEAQAILGIPLG